MKNGMIIEGLAESTGSLRETALEMAVQLRASSNDGTQFGIQQSIHVLAVAREFEDYLARPPEVADEVVAKIQKRISEAEAEVPESIEDGIYRDGALHGLNVALGLLIDSEAS